MEPRTLYKVSDQKIAAADPSNFLNGLSLGPDTIIESTNLKISRPEIGVF